MIIRDIIFGKKTSYGQFLSSGEGIFTNILADHLALLEQEDVVKKERDPANKSKFIYSITQKGFDLCPILIEIMIWSAKYDDDTPVTADFIKGVTSDKKAFVKSMTGELPKPLQHEYRYIGKYYLMRPRYLALIEFPRFSWVTSARPK